MQKETKKPEDRFLIAYSDLFSIYKRNRRKIIYGTLIGLVLAVSYVLTEPVKYQAIATFKEVKKNQYGSSTNITQMLLQNLSVGNETSAVALLKSRKLMHPIIEKMGLQVSITPTRKSPSFDSFSKVFSNFKTLYGHWKNSREPIFSDNPQPLSAIDVRYGREVPLNFKLMLASNDEYIVKNAAGEDLGAGKIGTPLAIGDMQFTLIRNSDRLLEPQEYSLHFSPLIDLYSELSKNLSFDTDKTGNTFLKVKHSHSNRLLSSKILNNIMREYQTLLNEEQRLYTSAQLGYLETRQNEIWENLEKLMLAKTSTQFDNIFTGDTIKSRSDEEAWIKRKEEYQSKIVAIDSEMAALTKERDHLLMGHTNLIKDTGMSGVLANICSLKQQREVLAAALDQMHAQDPEKQKEYFAKQLLELEETQKTSNEINTLITSLSEDETPSVSNKLQNDPGLMVGMWLDKLKEKQSDWSNAPVIDKESKKAVWDDCKSTCIAYLDNVNSKLNVYEKILQEKIINQNAFPTEFQGIDSDMAKQLYMDHSKQLNALQAVMRQYAFMIKQLQNENFEISSLSLILTDPISQDMLKEAIRLSLLLKDHNNNSNREHERIKDELALKRKFLAINIEQNIQLMRQKNALLEENLHKLQHLISSLPKKWVNEQLIKQRLQHDAQIIEEIAKLVESKNISANVDTVQSSPVDLALAPILPKKPPLLLFAIAGSFLGAFFSMGYFLVKELVSGIRASKNNLELAQNHVSGELSVRCTGDSLDALSDSDLETLRRLISYIPSYAALEGQTILAIEGGGPNFSPLFAKLMGKMRLKVLLMNVSFNSVLATSPSGLLQFLEGKVPSPAIIKKDGFDFIAAGGVSRYASELTSSEAFNSLLNDLKKNYDCIIAATDVSPICAEAESLAMMFDNVVVCVTDESFHSLQFYTDMENNKVSFVIHSV